MTFDFDRFRRTLAGRLRDDRDLVVDLQGFQQRIVANTATAATHRQGASAGCRLFVVQGLLRDRAVRRVDVTFELFVHSERGRTNRTLVRKVRRF